MVGAPRKGRVFGAPIGYMLNEILIISAIIIVYCSCIILFTYTPLQLRFIQTYYFSVATLSVHLENNTFLHTIVVIVAHLICHTTKTKPQAYQQQGH